MSDNVVKLEDYKKKNLTDKTNFSIIIEDNKARDIKKREKINKKNEEVMRRYKLGR